MLGITWNIWKTWRGSLEEQFSKICTASAKPDGWSCDMCVALAKSGKESFLIMVCWTVLQDMQSVKKAWRTIIQYPHSLSNDWETILKSYTPTVKFDGQTCKTFTSLRLEENLHSLSKVWRTVLLDLDYLSKAWGTILRDITVQQGLRDSFSRHAQPQQCQILFMCVIASINTFKLRHIFLNDDYSL